MTAAPEFLTVPELAELLRVKERKVYDLAASGSVPCTRATGKLLFPESEVRAWIARNQSGHRAPRPGVFLGSNDPLLEWALRQSQCGLATYLDGSADGLRRFALGEGIATGLHIQNENDDGWNTECVARNHTHDNVVLLAWAQRERGLVYKDGLDRTVSELKDIEGLRVATRQPNSGAARHFDRLVQKAGLREFEAVGPYFSEQDAILAVIDGAADVAFGLEFFAHRFGVSFLPVVTERFDVLVDRAAFFDPQFQKFHSFCRSEAFQKHVSTMTGYTINDVGHTRWNA